MSYDEIAAMRSARRLDHLIEELSRLRVRVQMIDPPRGESRRELEEHIAMATIAAIRLQVETAAGEDDVLMMADD